MDVLNYITDNLVNGIIMFVNQLLLLIIVYHILK